MHVLENITREIRRLKPEIESRFPIRLVSIFGSFARGHQTTDSDIDVLAEETDPSLGLFDIFAVERILAKQLGRRVEIVLERGIHTKIRDRVLAEAQPL
jgi:uncharacterized protein